MILTAAVAFVSGMVFAQVWPLLVRWIDTRSAVTVNIPREAIYRQICEAVDAENETNQSPIPNTGILNPHRRVGIAERRRMAELASLRAPTHQAAVTANNARAMETK